MRIFLCLFIVAITVNSVLLDGCKKKPTNSAKTSQDIVDDSVHNSEIEHKGEAIVPSRQQSKKVMEGEIQPLSKHQCVREITGFIFLSKPTEQVIDEEVKKTLESAFDEQQNGILLWIRINININELFVKIRENDPNIRSFKKEDFFGLAGDTKVTPFAPDGIVQVIDGNQFLKQDLIFPLSANMSDIEVIIGHISLAKFSLFRHDKQ